MTRPWRAGMCSMLCLLWISCAACATKPELSGPDGRPCFVGVLDSETTMLLRASHPKWELRSGDLIQTPECARQMSEDLLNNVYDLTR